MRQSSAERDERIHLVKVLGARHLLPVSGTKYQRVAEIAGAQRGRVNRRQLLAAGISSAMIETMIDGSHLLRLHRGVYAVGHTAPIELGDETAALLSCRGEAFLSHRSAAALWGVMPALPDAPVEITTLCSGARSGPGVRRHRARFLHPVEVRLHQRLPVTSPGRTLLDLAGVVSPRELERALDEALVRRITTLAQVLEVTDHASGRRGRAVLGAFVKSRRHSTITRSEAEERLLDLIRRAELPVPLMNVKLHGFTVDFFWPAARVVVEVDGYAYHSTKSAFERDRRKDAVLAQTGLTVIRVTWSQLVDQPYALIARVAAALTRVAAA